MKDKELLKDLIDLVKDLGVYDKEHLLLTPPDLALLRLNKVSGEMIYYLFNPDDIEIDPDEDEAKMEFESIEPYITQMYIDLILILHSIGIKDIESLLHTEETENYSDIFDTRLLMVLNAGIGALTKSMDEDNSALFKASIIVINTFIRNLINTYGVPLEIFVEKVEDAVFERLAMYPSTFEKQTSDVLRFSFKGNRTINIEVKVDRRRRSPFVGFEVQIGDNKTILFNNTSPYKSFIEASQYINEVTEYKDIRISMSDKTKAFINKYSIAYVKGPNLKEQMDNGFYPVLTPKGTKDMDGFLEALTKK